MSRINFRITAVPVLTVALLLSGCASLGSLESPELTLVHLQPVEATLFETTLQVQIAPCQPEPGSHDFRGCQLQTDPG